MAGLLALVTPLRADNPPTYLFEIDSSAVPGGFDPGFVALDGSNNVYVADYYNNRVVKFAANGTYLTQWGSSGSGNGQFSFPSGIAVDSSNNVYVADYSNNRVEKFDSNGNYLTQWGSGGSGNGQFDDPKALRWTAATMFMSLTRRTTALRSSPATELSAQWGSADSYGQFNSRRHCGGQQQQCLCGRPLERPR